MNNLKFNVYKGHRPLCSKFGVQTIFFQRDIRDFLKVRRDMGVQTPNEATKAASDPVDHVPPLITVSLISD